MWTILPSYFTKFSVLLIYAFIFKIKKLEGYCCLFNGILIKLIRENDDLFFKMLGSFGSQKIMLYSF